MRFERLHIVGGLVGISALAAIPPPVGVTLASTLTVAGGAVVGVEGVLFLDGLVSRLRAIANTADVGCEASISLQEQGEELAQYIFDVGLNVAEGAIVGTFGAFGKIADKVETLGGDVARKVKEGLGKEVSADSFDELVEDAGRHIRVPSNAADGVRLNRQLLLDEIVDHSFEKHVLNLGEFAGLGIRTKDQFRQHIESVLDNPSSIRYYIDGRSVYLHEPTGTVVVRNPTGSGQSTAFQPRD